jgi:hypothetical protein
MKWTLQSAFGYAMSMGGTVTACVLGETSEDLGTPNQAESARKPV